MHRVPTAVPRLHAFRTWHQRVLSSAPQSSPLPEQVNARPDGDVRCSSSCPTLPPHPPPHVYAPRSVPAWHRAELAGRAAMDAHLFHAAAGLPAAAASVHTLGLASSDRPTTDRLRQCSRQTLLRRGRHDLHRAERGQRVVVMGRGRVAQGFLCAGGEDGGAQPCPSEGDAA